MNIRLINVSFLVLGTLFLASACSVAKLEARLEANPQCKEVMNPKTGSLMPCPGSDKAFYREVGLAPAKPTPAINTSASSTPVGAGASSAVATPSNTAVPMATSAAKSTTVQTDCKPQIHKKTGGTLPCPAPD